MKTHQILNTLVFIGVLFMNYLANALPLGGLTTGEVSALYPNLFTPAGFTFSIWGVIYLGLLIFIIFQNKGIFGKAAPSPVVAAVGPWFIVNGLANMGWIFAWHNLQMTLSLLIMVLILFSLLQIYQALQSFPGKAFWWAKIPFSLYLSWICVATIANTTALLVDNGWNGGGIAPANWVIIMTGIAFLLSAWFSWKNRDIAFGLVTIWALWGIIVNLKASYPPGFPPIVANYIWMGLLAVLLLLRALRRPENLT